MQEEFYIGWQAEAPPSFVRVVRRFVVGLCVLVPALAVLLAYFQNGFSNGTFEFGKKTELEGIFYEKPFPFLAVENGKDAAGEPIFQKILLVGKGKFGYTMHGARYTADGVRFAENGQRIKVSGFLIYSDGKTALEVESVENKKEELAEKTPSAVYRVSSAVQLRGEITDPKCLFGVMNPGQGKPHRDCAARCIAGGIPPVLKVANATGETEYYLLADPNGEPLNARILPFVGDGVQLCGRLEQDGDWLVLYADPTTIQRVNKGALAVETMCN